MMCVEKDVLLDLCELFPQTSENIFARALERRSKFMRQRELNSNFHYSRRQLQKLGTGVEGRDPMNRAGDENTTNHKHGKTEDLDLEANFDDYEDAVKHDAEQERKKRQEAVDWIFKDEDELVPFMSDEDADKKHDDEEAMKAYLLNFNEKFDTIVNGLQEANEVICEFNDEVAWLKGIRN